MAFETVPLLALIWDIFKYVILVTVKVVRFSRVWRIVSRRFSHPDTPAQEVRMLLAVIDDDKLLLGNSKFDPLIKIRRALWSTRSQLLDLVDYSLAARGRNTPETISALNRIVGRWREDALPLLQFIISNQLAHPEIGTLAQFWIDKFDSEDPEEPATEGISTDLSKKRGGAKKRMS